jgi:hypothetical protein
VSLREEWMTAIVIRGWMELRTAITSAKRKNTLAPLKKIPYEIIWAKIAKQTARSRKIED